MHWRVRERVCVIAAARGELDRLWGRVLLSFALSAGGHALEGWADLSLLGEIKHWKWLAICGEIIGFAKYTAFIYTFNLCIVIAQRGALKIRTFQLHSFYVLEIYNIGLI